MLSIEPTKIHQLCKTASKSDKYFQVTGNFLNEKYENSSKVKGRGQMSAEI